MHTGHSARNQRASGQKIVANVVCVNPMTPDDVLSRFRSTLSDWSQQERDRFMAAVVASHGWNYYTEPAKAP